MHLVKIWYVKIIETNFANIYKIFNEDGIKKKKKEKSLMLL